MPLTVSAKKMSHPFPEPVHFTREDSPAGWKLKDWDTVNSLLSYFDTNGKSFVCFEKSNGSYVQLAGAKRQLTAEARIYDSPTRYRHFVFGKGVIRGSVEKVKTTDYEVEVDESQVLQMRHARLILRPWLEGHDFPDDFTMTDVTERFSEDPFVASDHTNAEQ